MPAVYNIPAGHSFAESLAQGILDQAGSDPLALSSFTILLPSRRACRTLRDVFLKLSQGRALLLPRMQPIGDVDADDVSLLLASEEGASDILSLPPAVSKLERTFLLARTIQSARSDVSFDQAVPLAMELGRFLDEVQTEGLDFKNLHTLVTGELSRHWQETVSFLDILTGHWPEILKEHGVIDFAERRNRLLEAQIKVWKKHPPQTPVIAAGSTGTVPAAAELLKCVADLPKGALVLPGLDQALDDVSWDHLGDEHPQANLKKLIGRLGLARADIKPWLTSYKPTAPLPRVRLMMEAMRPAKTADLWRRLAAPDLLPEALEGFTRIDAETPQQEADIIALILRETLETPGKTAALITPDRRLARRVSVALRRWGILADDSGGQPVTETAVGAWIMLTAELAEDRLSPVSLLGLLKHPFMASQLKPSELSAMIDVLDRGVLRGPRPAPGIDGLIAAVDRLDKPWLSEKQKLRAFINDLQTRLGGYLNVMQARVPQSLDAFLKEHVAAMERLASMPGQPGAVRLWKGVAGETAAGFLSDLRRAVSNAPPIRPENYVALLRGLLKTVTVRATYGTHPRISILGQVEARLFSADRVILSGLNEGTWPELPAHDPWMSRPMRRAFGLSSPEKSICLAAHDFVQTVTAPEVFITRAKKADGTPTVPARWLLRMEAVLKAADPDASMEGKAAYYLAMARDLDAPDHPPRPVKRPAPTPPLADRPRELSVTQIETWMRDPYQIYARKVLELEALDPIDADPGGAERGLFIHAALERFIRAHPVDLPESAAETLLEFGRQALKELAVPPEVEAFWWPRFEKVVHLFLGQEKEWRQIAHFEKAEVRGRLDMNFSSGSFTLTCKADRIDRLRAGGYAIIDYKSGVVPTPRDVKAGLSPQLPLEALMLEHGAFEDLTAGPVEDLIYWKVTGSGKAPVEFKSVVDEPGKGADAQTLSAEAMRGIEKLVSAFDDLLTPYYSRPRGGASVRFSDYDHLARVREWSISGDAEDAA